MASTGQAVAASGNLRRPATAPGPRPPRPSTAGSLSLSALVGRHSPEARPSQSADRTPQRARPSTAGASCRPAVAAKAPGRPASSTTYLGIRPPPPPRPGTASEYGRRTGNLHLTRPASAPCLSIPSGAAIAQHQLSSFKSPSVALQVQLRERLAQVDDAHGKVSEAQLRIYSNAFDAVIFSSQANAILLSKVKETYDQLVSPWMSAHGVSAAQGHLVPTEPAELELEVMLAPRIAELQQENRRLREAAGRLHRERLRRMQQSLEGASASAGLGADSCAAGASGDFRSVDITLETASKARPPWSAMRVSSTGVRGNGF
ncbi:unnamed protein product [Polarella glacialis]|uniref:Uncharacterized protein n=1 Tax=Polarella glacialis TaxID=89957 RepID=A0A813LGZ7_POLGL|nr:unnamed protein product [Polarella glacialis]CAE8728231.1 unnamed protein product [Polarella glacialis]